MISAIGAGALRIAQEVGGIVLLAGQVLRALVPPRMDARELWKNLYKMGNRSVPIVVLTAFFSGALTFAIGEFKADFRNAETHAALLGLLCGIAERSLATAVGRRAQDVPGVIGGKGP